MFSPRILKAVLVGAVSFYLALVVVGNVMDSNSNFAFVQHVMAMDSIYEHSTQRWRAVTNPELWRLGYVLILVYQTVAAGWLAWAAVSLARAKRAADWPAARNFASAGLVATLLLWMVPFIIIGGEWFQMWQSEHWNGLDSATQNFTVHGLILLYLQTSND